MPLDKRAWDFRNKVCEIITHSLDQANISQVYDCDRYVCLVTSWIHYSEHGDNNKFLLTVSVEAAHITPHSLLAADKTGEFPARKK